MGFRRCLCECCCSGNTPGSRGGALCLDRRAPFLPSLRLMATFHIPSEAQQLPYRLVAACTAAVEDKAGPRRRLAVVAGKAVRTEAASAVVGIPSVAEDIPFIAGDMPWAVAGS